MNCLLVTAHPLHDSLCTHLAAIAQRELEAAGHEVRVENLYDNDFAAPLSPQERRSYYLPPYAAAAVHDEVERLLWAETLVLVFPTWWFGFPAILKGWFDRVWAPGIAYDHASDYGPITPRLDNLRRVLAVTTLGSPWWVDRLVMGRPLRRILRRAIVGVCAPHCRFEMLSFYGCERLTARQAAHYAKRVGRSVRMVRG